MLFENLITESAVDTGLENIAESKYECGLEGALMHIYESECNYNEIIKAVGISEARYYAETGGDLLVESAGARKKYFDKVIAFFKTIIEKVQGIFKKFYNFIMEKTKTDKAFVKKVKSVLAKKDNSFGAEIECYNTTLGASPNYAGVPIPTETDVEKLIKANQQTPAIDTSAITANARKVIAGKEVADLKEMTAAIKANMLGEKKKMLVSRSAIEKACADIEALSGKAKEASKARDAIVKKINAYIKALEKASKSAAGDMKGKDAVEDGIVAGGINNINASIGAYKDVASIMIAAYGAEIECIKTFTKQAKAICIAGMNTATKKAKTSGKKDDKGDEPESTNGYEIESAGLFEFELV